MGYAQRMNGGHKPGFTGLIRPDGQPARSGKVCIGYPVGGSVTVPFHNSLLQITGYEIAKGETRLLSQVQHTSGLYVADNRTLLVQRFLETTDCDWLLQIDTDIQFPPTLIETMLEMAGGDKKVLAASVPLGAAELGAHPTGAYMITETPGVWASVLSVPMRPIKVDGIATAVVLVHREVYLAIAEREGQAWFHHKAYPDPKNKPGCPARDFKWLTQGEDLSFSSRISEAGYDIWIAHIPNVSHFKTTPYSHDRELAQRLAMEGTTGMGEIVQEG